MKSGTPGFIGSRLRQAREAKELTITALAELLELSKQAISQYENGSKTPNPNTLDNISELLKFPKTFFMRPLKKEKPNTIFFRSMSAATKRERIRVKHKLGWLKEIVDYLREFIYLKELMIPDFGIGDPLKLSMQEIEDMATACRRFWNLRDNPISNIMVLFENYGFIVTYGMLEADKLDALSEWDTRENTPYIYLGADKETAVRSKFDICHEVGHMVMHRAINERMFANTTNFKIIEEQANRFAGAFLLPEGTFLEDLYQPSLDAFWMLKEKWKVSIELMIMRCRNLGIIDADEYRRLWINLGRRGWRKKEPLDNSLPIEKPKFLSRSIKLLIEEGLQTKQDIVSSLSLPGSIIEELAGLPNGYLNLSRSEIEPFPGIKIRSSKNRSSNKAKVIPLKPNGKTDFS